MDEWILVAGMMDALEAIGRLTTQPATTSARAGDDKG
jgi:hypothetical protein